MKTQAEIAMERTAKPASQAQPGQGQQISPLREVPRAFTCCTDKEGRPRPMQKLVNQSTRIRKLEGGKTKNVAVMVTVYSCAKCGRTERTEEDL